MQKENQNKKTSHSDVMPTLAKFAQDAYFEFEVAELPDEMQEITNLLMETEQADQQHVRLKALNCLKFISDFSKALKPFSRDIIILETNKHIKHV